MRIFLPYGSLSTSVQNVMFLLFRCDLRVSRWDLRRDFQGQHPIVEGAMPGNFALVPREIGQDMWRCTTCSYNNSLLHRCHWDVVHSTPGQPSLFPIDNIQDGGNWELTVEEIHHRRKDHVKIWKLENYRLEVMY